jgi:hypothetical protein
MSPTDRAASRAIAMNMGCHSDFLSEDNEDGWIQRVIRILRAIA